MSEEVTKSLTLKLNDQQEAAVADMQSWVAKVLRTVAPAPYILQGYAGTGKTTSVRQLLDRLSIPLSRIALVAPTNRAAKVLQNKTGLHCVTIHRLIYLTVADEIDYVRARLQIWDQAVSLEDVAQQIIEYNETSLEELFLDTGGGNEEDYEKFVEQHRRTVLAHEGVEVPSDPAAEADYFIRIKTARMRYYREEIRKLLQENLKVRKKSPEEVIDRYSLILVDEASMVSQQVGEDLVGFGVPTIFVGDPFQLPPVKAKPWWHGRRANSVLTKIERQKGEGAGIPLAGELIRDGKRLRGNESVHLHAQGSVPNSLYVGADQIISGTHRVRELMCRVMRRELGYTTAHPHVGEKIVATYNDRQLGIMNGELYKVVSSELRGNDGRVTVMDLEDPYGHVIKNVTAWTAGFSGKRYTDELTNDHGKFWWGYCITCHQSQGSEWPTVVVCCDWPGDDKDRWLYTAVTRASKSCHLVGY